MTSLLLNIYDFKEQKWIHLVNFLTTDLCYSYKVISIIKPVFFFSLIIIADFYKKRRFSIKTARPLI